MINYIPFLKAKQNELLAMGELAPEVKQAICPLFDFPRKNENYNPEAYAKTAVRIAKSLTKHWGVDAEFYFDDLDISQRLQVDDDHQYAFVLRALQQLQVIPVVGLNRTSHNSSVAQLKQDGVIDSIAVAFRAEQADFDDFEDKKDDIDFDLLPIFDEFDEIDLILDCRLCTSLNVSETAQQIAAFARKFSRNYEKVRRIIITGSSIPASIGDAASTNEVTILPRSELEIITTARDLLADIEIIIGDYATVSPYFADKQFSPQLFPIVTAPRLIYSFNHSHYIARGTSLAIGGYEQYADLTNDLCARNFFRGSDYSSGENYIIEKRERIGSNATNGTIVKPSVVAHITYMVLDAKL